MKIFFIAHGGIQIGMGHIMRTLALAEQFRQQGHDVNFISNYKQGIEVIRKSSIPIFQPKIKNNNKSDQFMYGNKEDLFDEINFLNNHIKEKIDLLIVDSYNVTMEYFVSLQKFAKFIAYIDDLNSFSYPVNIIINGMICADKINYKRRSEQLYLLGMDYTILRKEFHNIGIRKVPKKLENIMVTTGGSDPYHMTEKLIELLQEFIWISHVTIHVLIGGGFSKDILINISKLNLNNIICYENINNTSDIMLHCDVAISAGGTTIYELAACGVPSLIFCYADNQKYQINEFAKKGLFVNIGAYNNLNVSKFKKELNRLKTNYKLRKNISKILQAQVSGNGAKNIVNAINNYMECDAHIT